MVSRRSRALPPLLRAIGYKKAFEDRALMRQMIDDLVLRPTSFAPPRRMIRSSSSVEVSVDRSSGWPVYTVTPRDPSARTQRRVVYSHGGAWVKDITSWHWRFIAELALSSGATFIVPIYPLAPFATAGDVVPRVAQLLGDQAAQVGAENVVAMGDSAGGQISLSAALELTASGVRLGDTVLIAPALDLTLQNPDIPAVEAVDPWLAREGTRECIELWRGERGLDDPMVSPLAASAESLGALGPVVIFAGTLDIVIPDCRLLAAKARAAGVEIQLHEGAGQVHVYPLLPIPEGKDARRVIAGRLRAGSDRVS